MPDGFDKIILAQMTIRGAIAQMVECRYEPGVEVTEQFSSIMLRWRVAPQNVRLRAWQRNSVPLRPGRLTLFPADMEAGAVASDVYETTRCLALHIKPDWLDEVWGGKKKWLFGDPAGRLNINNSGIEVSMRKAAAELTAPGSCSKLLIEAHSLTIAAHLFRHLENRNEETALRADTLAARRVKRVEDIFLHSDEIPNLADIATELGVGLNRLREVFRNTTGKTLFKFVEDVRIAKAKDLIRQNKLPLKRISHQLGFCNAGAFSTAFRKAVGMTPREYRNDLLS